MSRSIGVGLGLLAILLSACVQSPQEKPAQGGTLVVGLHGEIDAWNPYVAQQSVAADVLDLIFPRLVLERPDGSFDPWLAESWGFSDDGTELTFNLRKNAQWSDGLPIDCEDVRFTYRAQLAEELAWPGYDIKSRITSVDCREPHVVVFRFEEAYQDQILDANDDAIIPRRFDEVPFSEWRSTRWEEFAISGGPFRLDRVATGQEAVLVRNESWWGDPSRLDEVIFRYFPDEDAILRQLESGEVDVQVKIPPRHADSLESNPRVELLELPSLSYAYVGWNTLAPTAYRDDRKARDCDGTRACGETAEMLRALSQRSPHPILSDPKVRHALSLGIDREDIVAGLWSNRARPGTTPIVSALWAHDPNTIPLEPSKASTLLTEAGWMSDESGRRAKNGQPLRIEVIVNADNALRQQVLERVAASLDGLGVEIVPVPLPRGEFVARARLKQFDAIMSGWRAGTRIEPQTILHSRVARERGNNLIGWFTAASDELLEQAETARNRDEARPLWSQWQRHFIEQAPYSVLYEESLLIGLSARVRDASPTMLSPYRGLETWWIEPRSD